MDLSPHGTAEDLFALFARADYEFVGAPVPKGRIVRNLVEPLFQAFGRALAELGELLPAAVSLSIQDRLYAIAQGGGGEPMVGRDDPALQAAEALALEAERRTGKRAAFACLLAHAPVDPQWLHLNVLLFRTAMIGLALARKVPCRPRLVNAVDAYGLDMLGVCGEGIYAGTMSRAHLGFLRLTRARPPAGRLLTAGVKWPGIVWRILGNLREGGELIMVLAGGVPITSRAYYALREAVGRLCRTSPGAAAPRAALERLASREPGFADFLSSGKVLCSRSAWRLIEAWVMDRALTRTGRAALGAGRLDPVGEAAWVTAAAALEVPPADAAAARKILQAELARETPFRQRFLSVIARRVAASGRPLVLLPLAWGRIEAVNIAFGSPVCLLPAPRGLIRVLDSSGEVAQMDSAEFTRSFVEPRFP